MKKTTVNSKKTVAMRIGGQNSDLAIKDFDKSNRICGLTNGAFSLISLIDSVLKKTGKANVIISTWSAGLYDIGVMNDLILSGRVDDFKIILDRSFKTRQKNYAVTIEDLFTPENIRTTNTHSKFVLIWNDDWNVCIRSSMNLNENKRCENFDVDNDIDIFNLFKSFSDELFDKQQAGVIESRGIVDKTFDTLFDDSDFSTKKKVLILNLILDLTKKEDIKKTGRPPADIDWDVVDNFLKAHCDGVGIASFFGVHPNTLYRLVKEKYNISFDDYRRQKQAEGKELIRAKQYQTAMQGDKAMLIWLGKQLLDQKEKSDVTTNNESLNSQPKAILPDGTEIEI